MIFNNNVSQSTKKILCNFKTMFLCNIKLLQFFKFYNFILAILIEDGCTIPFIARYRKEKTGNMESAKLREASDIYQELK